MNTNNKPLKIDVAIRDTKLRLEHTQTEIMLLSRERDVLKKQLDALETIKENKNYD